MKVSLSLCCCLRHVQRFKVEIERLAGERMVEIELGCANPNFEDKGKDCLSISRLPFELGSYFARVGRGYILLDLLKRVRIDGAIPFFGCDPSGSFSPAAMTS